MDDEAEVRPCPPPAHFAQADRPGSPLRLPGRRRRRHRLTRLPRPGRRAVRSSRRDGETVTDARTLARQIGLLRAMRSTTCTASSASTPGSRTRAASPACPATSRDGLGRPSPDAAALWTDHVSGKMTAGERDARLTPPAGGRGRRARRAHERPLPHRRRRCADARRGRLHRPAPLAGRHRAGRRQGDPQGRRQDGRHHRHPRLRGRGRRPRGGADASEFDRVWQIVKALRDHDEDLAEELDELRRELGQRGTLGERPGKIVLDLPVRRRATSPAPSTPGSSRPRPRAGSSGSDCFSTT